MISGIVSPEHCRQIYKPSSWFSYPPIFSKIVAFEKELEYSFPWYGKYPNFDQQFEDLWTEEEKQEIYSKPWEYIK